MTIPIGSITRDYLRNHKLCPQQCAPNFFGILGAVDALDRHLGLGLTWHDVVHLYEGHQQKGAGFYLKPGPTLSGSFRVFPNLTKG